MKLCHKIVVRRKLALVSGGPTWAFWCIAFFTNATYIPWRVLRTGPAALGGAVVRMGIHVIRHEKSVAAAAQ